MARTSTYLNFPSETEEAFLFYKEVFKTDFIENGIRRFSDIPSMEGMPPMSEKDLNLVMHVELPITGGHILMGTDAPESFGLKVQFGNNVTINLEPDTKEETIRLFKALSKGGEVTMDLSDTFWGAHFGSCKDKFGTIWSFNFMYEKA